MNEKIYLGFAGKENIRLGESLRLIQKYYNNVISIPKQMFIFDVEGLNYYLSNVYLMYNIKNYNQLLSVINMYTVGIVCKIINPEGDRRDSFLNAQKEDDYVISFDTFKFFSEKLWPQIVKAFFSNVSKNTNYFILRANIPFSKIQKLSKGKKFDDSRIMFQQDITKWLNFHFIGKIETVEYKNKNIIFSIKIAC